MYPAETLERMTGLLEELDEASRTIPIIVEGRKDKEALRDLGIKGRIIILNDGHSVLGTCEELAKTDTIAMILTDWDRRGGQLARSLMDSLEACDMKHETDIRAKLSYLTKKEIKDVEGLPGFMRRLRQTVERTV